MLHLCTGKTCADRESERFCGKNSVTKKRNCRSQEGERRACLKRSLSLPLSGRSPSSARVGKAAAGTSRREGRTVGQEGRSGPVLRGSVRAPSGNRSPSARRAVLCLQTVAHRKADVPYRYGVAGASLCVYAERTLTRLCLTALSRPCIGPWGCAVTGMARRTVVTAGGPVAA